MGVRWLTAFIDRPADSFDAAVQFWLAATGSVLSPYRGEHGQFATLVPAEGDAYLRVQRVRSGGGCHLDLHVDDVEEFAGAARAAGALVERPMDGLAVLRSPAGMVACGVHHRGEARRPLPGLSSGGVPNLVDQLCIDIPATAFDRECAFWSDLTGWKVRASTVRSEFVLLVGPPGMPLRLLLQRREDDDGPACAHLDLACDDVELLVADHQGIGAARAGTFQHWTTMIDPSGWRYCITGRDPWTGRLG